jgi:hypothetical protein
VIKFISAVCACAWCHQRHITHSGHSINGIGPRRTAADSGFESLPAEGAPLQGAADAVVIAAAFSVDPVGILGHAMTLALKASKPAVTTPGGVND